MTTKNLPALSLRDLKAVPNSNGNTKEQMVKAMLDLRAAYDAVLVAIAAANTDVAHGRNYQTVAPDTWLQGQLQLHDYRNLRSLKEHATDLSDWAMEQAVRLNEL